MMSRHRGGNTVWIRRCLGRNLGAPKVLRDITSHFRRRPPPPRCRATCENGEFRGWGRKLGWNELGLAGTLPYLAY